jgi:DNA-binding NtrC family response regulator
MLKPMTRSGSQPPGWLGQTWPKEDDRGRKSAQLPVLHLVRVLGYDRPHAPGSRHNLDGLTEVVLGRGEHDSAQRQGSVLTLRVADPRMSAQHSRIVRVDGQWIIADIGSRNGTFVDGAKVDRGELGDGVMVELGGTAFVLRTLVPGPKADIHAGELATPLPDIRTFSTTFEAALVNLRRLAVTQQSIILHGETGTGKEVIARALHQASMRTGPFIAVNCGALPPNLVESELFGHKKGAFSGAMEDRAGLVRAADKGTLLLDEIGDLPLSTQAALLRVLQEKEVQPVGATRPIPVDLRVLAASHRDLETEVATSRFREDLWSRLAGYTAEIPALRERREDLGLLIATLLARRGIDDSIRFTPEAGAALMQYHWPRNVRELEQVLASATALAADGVVELAHLPRSIGGPPSRPSSSAPMMPAARASTDAREPLSPADVARREELCASLARHRGNIAAVGREMGVARMQIHRWLERFEIDINAYRDG